MNVILDKIKKAREAKGLSQTDVADKMGIGLRQYQNIEAGKFPKYKTEQIEKLEKILGIDLYAMIYEKEYTEQTFVLAQKNIDFKEKYYEALEEITRLQREIIDHRKNA